MNRRKRRKKKSRIVLYIILVIACAALYFVLFRTYTEKTSGKVIDKIKGYGYTLEKRDSDFMKETFASLKEELTKEKVSEEKYAKLLSKLFVIDLYTINNKKSRYDVGGTEYVYDEYAESYKLKVEDTLYRFLENNNKNKSKLPEVSEVTIDDIAESSFNYHDEKYDGYEVKLSWNYVKDLDYDDEGVINIIKDGKKLYIASFTNEIEVEDE